MRVGQLAETFSVVRTPPGTRMSCGMTLIPADPTIDPQFVRPAPTGRFTIRAGPSRCARDDA